MRPAELITYSARHHRPRSGHPSVLPTGSRRFRNRILGHCYIRWISWDRFLCCPATIVSSPLSEPCEAPPLHHCAQQSPRYMVQKRTQPPWSDQQPVGLGCSPVLVSGTKKLFLKWIRSAVRQKRIEVPRCRGPVRWGPAHGFFQPSTDHPREIPIRERVESCPPQDRKSLADLHLA